MLWVWCHAETILRGILITQREVVVFRVPEHERLNDCSEAKTVIPGECCLYAIKWFINVVAGLKAWVRDKQSGRVVMYLR